MMKKKKKECKHEDIGIEVDRKGNTIFSVCKECGTAINY